ncbi:putative histone deacetylase complex subunit SAP30/SAP30, SAP30 domain superfamily [Helianthus annuus]|uniref:Histone deacetylase complex subunit SAP30/SAP30, SAP30 domain superfamily n=1 Tax=Helianthus annuus TaxID=4232 RepID=A0A251RZC9_HELAN|nr:putative histone deacetylase complex subunit SAP30/SAP30, SAP30 domain superfamily [Helianthus annuus]
MYQTYYVNNNNGGGTGGDQEELSVLPRHTKVVVTGNNRTKSVLVGLHGVVKKAVGLGGWHWLVLTNGIEVKLQRNALSVIEAPTGNEDDDDDDDFELENGQSNGSDMVNLHHNFDVVESFLHWIPSHMVVLYIFITLLCMWTRRLQKVIVFVTMFSASDDTQKLHRSRHHLCKSTTGSPRNKTVGRSLFHDSQSRASFTTSRAVKIDLRKLEMAALQRYWLHFNLSGVMSNPSKEQLVDIVQRHFMSQTMDELQVIVGFVQAAKKLKMV